MKRGVIRLSPLQLSLLHRAVAPNKAVLALLNSKCMLASEAVTVEVSAEDVETLLDALPIPSPEEPQELSQLREVFITFLRS